MNAKEIMNNLREVEDIAERLQSDMDLPFPITENKFQQDLIYKAISALRDYQTLLSDILEKTEVGI